MVNPTTQNGGEVKFSIVPVNQMPSVTRAKSKYLKVTEAAKNLEFGKSIRILLGTGDKANRNAAVTISNHLTDVPHQNHDGKEYALDVVTRTEGDKVNAYIYWNLFETPSA